MTPKQSYFLLIILTYRYFLTQVLSVVFTHTCSFTLAQNSLSQTYWYVQYK